MGNAGCNVKTLEAGFAPRGWHEVTVGDQADGHGGERYAVRDGFVLLPCTGDAHSNAHIDNCGVCLGHAWGWVAVHESELGFVQRMEAAICTFPARFGLRGYPGEEFRIGVAQSMLLDLVDGECRMYTQRLVDGEWRDFAKGTVSELRRNVVALPLPDEHEARAVVLPAMQYDYVPAAERGGKRTGAGRKPKPAGTRARDTKVRVVLSLDPADAELLVTMSKSRDCTQSALVVGAIKHAFGKRGGK